jgi:hypothetical protein
VKPTLLCLLLIVAVVPARAQYGRVIYFSPNEQLQAVVTPTDKHEGGFNEHRIEIRSSDGKPIAVNDHSSDDHQHGYGVIFAAWTPDSRFFVYSVASSGGHSAWHFPTHVFVRDRRAFINLDQAVDHPLVRPHFLLSPPNRFHSERLSPEGYGHQNVPIDINLQDVKWPKTK